MYHTNDPAGGFAQMVRHRKLLHYISEHTLAVLQKSTTTNTEKKLYIFLEEHKKPKMSFKKLTKYA